jgi:hypothetical protein
VGGRGEYMQFLLFLPLLRFLVKIQMYNIYIFYMSIFFYIRSKKILADKVMQTRIENLPLSLG